MSLVNPPLTNVVKSVQRGTINTAANLITDITIAPVDLNKAKMQYNGVYVVNATTNNDFSPQMRLLNSTTVRIQFGDNQAQVRNANWEVVEFV